MNDDEFWKRNLGGKAQKEIQSMAEVLDVDPKAVQILYNSYYNLDNKDAVWPEDRIEPPSADYRFAKAAGVMHDVVDTTHDEVLNRLTLVRDSLDRKVVSNAFIASLLTGRLDLRSPFATYARHLNLLTHQFWSRTLHVAAYHNNPAHIECSECGWTTTTKQPTAKLDRDYCTLIRFRFANGMHNRLIYAMVELEDFSKSAPTKPTQEDRDNFHKLLDAIRALPARSKTGDLIKASTGLIQGDKYKRQQVLEALGYAGILQPKIVQWVGERYFDSIEIEALRIRPNYEWDYPTGAWTGEDGVDEKAVKFWFPGFQK